jgi:hypothetical protein
VGMRCWEGRTWWEWFFIAIVIAIVLDAIFGGKKPVPHEGEACGPFHHWGYIREGYDLELSCEEDR